MCNTFRLKIDKSLLLFSPVFGKRIYLIVSQISFINAKNSNCHKILSKFH